MRVVPTALLILAACSLRARGSVPGSRRNSDTLISDAAQMPRPLNPRPLPVLSPRALRPSTQASRPRTGMHERHPGQAACKEMRFTQQLDHFAWNNDATWQQRYFVCDAEWRQPTPASPAGPIFFYCGNEGDVEGYVTHTGLMFENAGAFGALLIFAEHRYYGQSLPLGNATSGNLSFLTHEQALADYATLLTTVKSDLAAESADVIAFGGSYGGMLAAWFRMKYPHVILGSIAASAPILAFPGPDGGEEYANGGEDYWAVVTRDASAAAGASPHCIPAVRAAWDVIDAARNTPEGRSRLSAGFNMCSPLSDPVDVDYLKLYVAMAFDTMAMGNFPYRSDYLTGGAGFLPPWPVRVACRSFEAVDLADADALVSAVSAAAAVLYNASGSLTCHSLPADSSYDGIWDYQWCTELLCQESYFRRDGVKDMFYPFAMTPAQVDAHCLDKYGVTPRRAWITALYGGIEGVARATNIVFSNGGFDPWSFGGVTPSTPLPAFTSSSIERVWIEEGAHHLDLFFSHPADPPGVRLARKREVAAIQKWLSQAAEQRLRENAAAGRKGGLVPEPGDVVD